MEVIGAVSGSIAVITAIAASVRALYRRIAKASEKRVLALAPGMTLQRFTKLLGEPDYSTPNPTGSVTYLWVHKHYYAMALVEADQVKALSVTTRHRLFAPGILHQVGVSDGAPSEVVRLGRTPFARIKGQSPNGVQAIVGASWWTYRESYYYGRPGAYRYYVFSINEAGLHLPGHDSLVQLLVEDGRGGVELGDLHKSMMDERVEAFLTRDEVEMARLEAIPNTYTISDLHLPDHRDALPYGPAAIVVSAVEH